MSTNPTAPMPTAASPTDVATAPGIADAVTQAHMNSFSFDLTNYDADISIVSASPRAMDAIKKMTGSAGPLLDASKAVALVGIPGLFMAGVDPAAVISAAGAAAMATTLTSAMGMRPKSGPTR